MSGFLHIGEVNPKRMRVRRCRRRVMTFSDLAGDAGRSGAVAGRWVFVTLTYAKVEDWCSGHVSEFLDCVRQWARRRKITVAYVWVAELQRRGAVHYHLAFKLPKAYTLPKPDRQGWWKHGLSSVEAVRKSVRNYLSKYLSKQSERSEFPRGLRLCGMGGLPSDARAWARWQGRPSYVREECEPSDMPRRVRGGHVLVCGAPLPTPFAASLGKDGTEVRLYLMSLDQRASNWAYWRRRDEADREAEAERAACHEAVEVLLPFFEEQLCDEDKAFLSALRGLGL